MTISNFKKKIIVGAVVKMLFSFIRSKLKDKENGQKQQDAEKQINKQ